jgi:hypothetical protein
VEMPNAHHIHACNKLSLLDAVGREEFSNTLISMCRSAALCVSWLFEPRSDVLIRPKAAIIHSVVHHLFQRRRSKVVDRDK